MLYIESKILSCSQSAIWRVINDVRHYIHKDPFHSELKFLSEQHEGVGTEFSLRHSYWPNFPFRPDVVTCRISVSEPEREQVMVETNAKSYRSHTQRFLLEPVEGGTKVTYEIQYTGISLWMLPWRMWVKWNVLRRMREKLRDLEAMCGDSGVV